jgi:hypothetical protein
MSRIVPAGTPERAVAIFAGLAEARWEEARRDFGERMRERLDADRLAKGWAHTVSLIGRFEMIGEPAARQAGEETLVDVPLHFEAAEATGRVTFDGDGAVIGLFIRPAPDQATQ